MSKKILFFLFLGVVFLGAIYFLKENRENGLYAKNENYCAFCDEKVISNQLFYEDDLIMGLCTHKPIVPGHFLIIPKRHVERFENLSDEELIGIGHLIKRVHAAASKIFGTGDYLILQKNGLAVGQTVPHVHFHYIPREEEDSSTIKFLFQFYISNFKKPLSRETMAETAEKMREALSLKD